MRRLVPIALGLLLALALTLETTLTPGSAQESKVQKLVFASAGFEDSNRFWMISRPDHLQYDPFLETLLEVDPKTGEYTPRLAEKWSNSPDFKQWTFQLRKGVQFHNGFGPFTAKDVVHSHSLMLRPEATATLTGFWRQVEKVEVVNDYQVVFHFKRPTTVMPYAASRAGDLRIVSKAQWDKKVRRGSRSGRPAPAPTGTSGASPACPSASSASTTTGTRNGRRSRSWCSGWRARNRRGWRCSCPARRTSPTCPASCRRTP